VVGCGGGSRAVGGRLLLHLGLVEVPEGWVMTPFYAHLAMVIIMILALAFVSAIAIMVFEREHSDPTADLVLQLVAQQGLRLDPWQQLMLRQVFEPPYPVAAISRPLYAQLPQLSIERH
jgi:hypothetical protein